MFVVGKVPIHLQNIEHANMTVQPHGRGLATWWGSSHMVGVQPRGGGPATWWGSSHVVGVQPRGGGPATWWGSSHVVDRRCIRSKLHVLCAVCCACMCLHVCVLHIACCV